VILYVNTFFHLFAFFLHLFLFLENSVHHAALAVFDFMPCVNDAFFNFQILLRCQDGQHDKGITDAVHELLILALGDGFSQFANFFYQLDELRLHRAAFNQIAVFSPFAD
jgi:hypothetical protein